MQKRPEAESLWKKRLVGDASAPARALAVVVALLAGAACFGEILEEPPATGVEIQELEDGGYSLISTARASERAIAAGSLSMKRQTACEAADLALEDTLRKDARFSAGKDRYQLRSTDFLYQNEYCRRYGTYNAVLQE